MDASKYIVIQKGALTKDICQKIIDEYKDDAWMDPTVENTYKPEIRNCKIIELSRKEVIDLNPDSRKKYDELLFSTIHNALRNYIEQHPLSFFINSDNGYSLLRYQPGQYVKNHIDVGASDHRVLSVSIQLNDDYTGGEWRFWGKKKLKVEAGDIIIFPSNFCFEHEIMPVKTGERYSILTFMSCK